MFRVKIGVIIPNGILMIKRTIILKDSWRRCEETSKKCVRNDIMPIGIKTEPIIVAIKNTKKIGTMRI